MTDPADETAERLATARTRAASMFRALPEEVHELGGCSRPPATSLALVGGRCGTRCWAARSVDLRLHHLRPPRSRPRRSSAPGRGTGRSGTWARLRHPRRGARRGEGRDHDLSHRVLRPGLPQAAGRVRRHPRRRSLAPRLHRQRDGGAPALLELVDPSTGFEATRRTPLRTPVAPVQSFDDDPLRMMRAVRFVAQLGFRIEDATADAIEQLAERITIVSAERVREEPS